MFIFIKCVLLWKLMYFKIKSKAKNFVQVFELESVIFAGHRVFKVTNKNNVLVLKK